MSVRPKCPICGLDIMQNEGKDAEGKVVEAQVSYWMHDPRNPQVDVQVVGHQVCYDKVKVVDRDFDVLAKFEAYKTYPTLDKNSNVVAKAPTDFIKAKVI